jgi:hypothetical protein
MPCNAIKPKLIFSAFGLPWFTPGTKVVLSLFTKVLSNSEKGCATIFVCGPIASLFVSRGPDFNQKAKFHAKKLSFEGWMDVALGPHVTPCSTQMPETLCSKKLKRFF